LKSYKKLAVGALVRTLSLFYVLRADELLLLVPAALTATAAAGLTAAAATATAAALAAAAAPGSHSQTSFDGLY